MKREFKHRGELMTMLKKHRLAKGLTLARLAKRIGVSRAACSSWETGRFSPNPTVVPKLARVLGIPPMELVALLGSEATEPAAA